jgi:hypothetical protein
MPIQPHPLVQSPASPAQRAWRYMDFAGFVSLISRSELYLCNLEVLSKFDSHEGLLSVPNYRHRAWHTIADLTDEERKQIALDGLTEEKERIQFESHRNSREYWLRRRFYDRRTLLVNCWHLNEYESAAMWSQYAASGPGIAITSTYDRIVNSLASAPQALVAGVVKYLDWDKEPVDNSFVFPFSKRKSFAHENEFRILYWDIVVQEKVNALCARLTTHMMDHLYRRITTPINWDLIRDEVEAVSFTAGLYVPIDVGLLIDEVYVSPTSPDWFVDVVDRVCNQFALHRLVQRSDILTSPMR